MLRLPIALFAVLLIASPAVSQIQLEDAFPFVSFTNPVDIQAAGDGNNRLFIVEKRGVISVVPNDPSVTLKKTFLDIQSRVVEGHTEEGLLGMVFHPDFPDSNYFYVDYTATGPDRTVISRFTVSQTNPDSADATSERVIIEIGQPADNHNAGQLAFGPDGYLYIGLGDGGGAGDPSGNAQNLQVLLGKMLRVDVDSTTTTTNYAVPPGNPYVGNASGYREEIYASGFRNPWRYSFDPVTGWLWLGDVGQSLYEEVDVVENGANYGWNVTEGYSCYNPPVGCNTAGLTPPVWVYDHSQGRRAITGGYVYRGSDIASLVGRYVFADYASGTIYALQYDGINPAVSDSLLDTTTRISTFGVDEDGEMYLAGFFQSKIFRIRPVPTGIAKAASPRAPGTLEQNFPNPFQPETNISFTLFDDGAAELAVFDVRGRRVATLVQKRLDAGPHAALWNGRDDSGSARPSGVYFCRLVVDGRTVGVRRMVLLR